MPDRKTADGKKLFVKGGAPGPGRPKLPPGARESRKRVKAVAKSQKNKVVAPEKPAPSAAPEISTPPKPVVPPPITPAPDGAPSIPPAKPDTTLFGEHARTPKPDATPPPSSTPPPKPDEPKKEPEPASHAEPINHRPLAEMAFAMWTQIFAMMFGDFWFPRRVGHDVSKGEIPFDEREPVVSALVGYMNFVGMVVLTPLQNLWLAIAGYSLPRLGATFQAIKHRYWKKTPTKTATAAPNTEQRAPAGETVDIKTEPEKKTEPAAPAATQQATDEAAENFK